MPQCSGDELPAGQPHAAPQRVAARRRTDASRAAAHFRMPPAAPRLRTETGRLPAPGEGITVLKDPKNHPKTYSGDRSNDRPNDRSNDSSINCQSDCPEETNSIKAAIRLLGQADREHRAIIESKVAQLGVHRTQHMMLMYLSKNEPAAQNDIARAFDVSASAVAVSAKKLESAGLIERTRKTGDERTNCLKLTEKGAEMVKKSRELFLAVDAAMFDGFTEEDVAVFTKYLSKAKQNLVKYAQDREETRE